MFEPSYENAKQVIRTRDIYAQAGHLCSIATSAHLPKGKWTPLLIQQWSPFADSTRSESTHTSCKTLDTGKADSLRYLSTRMKSSASRSSTCFAALDLVAHRSFKERF